MIKLIKQTIKPLESRNEDISLTPYYKYFTIWEDSLYEMMPLLINDSNNLFAESVFEIISDDKLGEELRNNFLSTNRSEEYDKTYTSVSRITNDLYPMDKTSAGLIYWMKNQTHEQYRIQDEKNRKSQNKGNDVHLFLERYSCDKKHYSLKNINDYLEEIENKEICFDLFHNFKKYKDKNAESYYDEIVKNTDLIYSEIFIKDDELQVQGTIDSVVYFKNKLTLSDYKTTSKMTKNKRGIMTRFFKPPSQLGSYKRQICLYGMLLKNNNSLIDNLNKLEYNINMFHLIGKEYAIYEFDKNEIMQWQDNLYHVINWFNTNKVL